MGSGETFSLKKVEKHRPTAAGKLYSLELFVLRGLDTTPSHPPVVARTPGRPGPSDRQAAAWEVEGGVGWDGMDGMRKEYPFV